MPKRPKKRGPKRQGQQQGGEMTEEEFLREVEHLIEQWSQQIYEAAQQGDIWLIEGTVRAWTQAQGLWLQHARGMSVEKAKAVIISFATVGEFSKWSDGQKSGPPPTVLSLYPKE